MFVGWPSDTAERAARRCRRAWRNGQIGDGNLHTVGQTTSEALTRRMELRPDLKDDAGVRSVDDEPPATVAEPIRAARSRACNSGPCLNIVDDDLLNPSHVGARLGLRSGDRSPVRDDVEHTSRINRREEVPREVRASALWP